MDITMDTGKRQRKKGELGRKRKERQERMKQRRREE